MNARISIDQIFQILTFDKYLRFFFSNLFKNKYLIFDIMP